MPLMPKRVKHRKVQRGNLAGLSHKCNKLSHGEFGLQSLERVYLTANQIEAARVAINRHLKRHGKTWIHVFPYKPYTKKPLETRMGKGKGNVEFWVSPVKPGRMLFELSGCTENEAKEAMSLAAAKLPVRCKFVMRHGTL